MFIGTSPFIIVGLGELGIESSLNGGIVIDTSPFSSGSPLKPKYHPKLLLIYVCAPHSLLQINPRGV